MNFGAGPLSFCIQRSFKLTPPSRIHKILTAQNGSLDQINLGLPKGSVQLQGSPRFVPCKVPKRFRVHSLRDQRRSQSWHLLCFLVCVDCSLTCMVSVKSYKSLSSTEVAAERSGIGQRSRGPHVTSCTKAQTRAACTTIFLPFSDCKVERKDPEQHAVGRTPFEFTPVIAKAVFSATGHWSARIARLRHEARLRQQCVQQRADTTHAQLRR